MWGNFEIDDASASEAEHVACADDLIDREPLANSTAKATV